MRQAEGQKGSFLTTRDEHLLVNTVSNFFCTPHKSAHTIPCCLVIQDKSCTNTSQHIPYLVAWLYKTRAAPTQVSTYHTLLLGYTRQELHQHKSAHTIPCCLVIQDKSCTNTSQHIPYLVAWLYKTRAAPTQVSTYHTLLLGYTRQELHQHKSAHTTPCCLVIQDKSCTNTSQHIPYLVAWLYKTRAAPTQVSTYHTLLLGYTRQELHQHKSAHTIPCCLVIQDKSCTNTSQHIPHFVAWLYKTRAAPTQVSTYHTLLLGYTRQELHQHKSAHTIPCCLVIQDKSCTNTSQHIPHLVAWLYKTRAAPTQVSTYHTLLLGYTRQELHQHKSAHTIPCCLVIQDKSCTNTSQHIPYLVAWLYKTRAAPTQVSTYHTLLLGYTRQELHQHKSAHTTPCCLVIQDKSCTNTSQHIPHLVAWLYKTRAAPTQVSTYHTLLLGYTRQELHQHKSAHTTPCCLVIQDKSCTNTSQHIPHLVAWLYKTRAAPTQVSTYHTLLLGYTRQELHQHKSAHTIPCCLVIQDKSCTNTSQHITHLVAWLYKTRAAPTQVSTYHTLLLGYTRQELHQHKSAHTIPCCLVIQDKSCTNTSLHIPYLVAWLYKTRAAPTQVSTYHTLLLGYTRQELHQHKSAHNTPCCLVIQDKSCTNTSQHIPHLVAWLYKTRAAPTQVCTYHTLLLGYTRQELHQHKSAHTIPCCLVIQDKSCTNTSQHIPHLVAWLYKTRAAPTQVSTYHTLLLGYTRQELHQHKSAHTIPCCLVIQDKSCTNTSQHITHLVAWLYKTRAAPTQVCTYHTLLLGYTRQELHQHKSAHTTPCCLVIQDKSCTNTSQHIPYLVAWLYKTRAVPTQASTYHTLLLGFTRQELHQHKSAHTTPCCLVIQDKSCTNTSQHIPYLVVLLYKTHITVKFRALANFLFH